MQLITSPREVVMYEMKAVMVRQERQFEEVQLQKLKIRLEQKMRERSPDSEPDKAA
jgi:hypothetical protein